MIHTNFVYDLLTYVKRCYQCLLCFLLLFGKFHIQLHCYEDIFSSDSENYSVACSALQHLAVKLL